MSSDSYVEEIENSPVGSIFHVNFRNSNNNSDAFQITRVRSFYTKGRYKIPCFIEKMSRFETLHPPKRKVFYTLEEYFGSVENFHVEFIMKKIL